MNKTIKNIQTGAADVAPKYNHVVAGQLLCIRDALAAGDYDEAYYLLYLIADPNVSSMTPWAEMERIAKAANAEVRGCPISKLEQGE